MSKLIGGKWKIGLPDPLPPLPHRIITISPAGEAAEVAKDVGTEMYEDLPKDKILRKPLSPTGGLPITHYICVQKTTEEKAKKQLAYECKMGTRLFYLDGPDSEHDTPLKVLRAVGLKFVDPRRP
jgi:hypothetical protein